MGTGFWRGLRRGPRAWFALGIVFTALTVATAAAVFAAPPPPHAVPVVSGYRVVPPPVPGVDTPPLGWTLAPAAHTLRNLSYGPAGGERVDLYLPDNRLFQGARPVIVWLHPGGWSSQTRLDTAPVIQREVARGFAVASIDYALAPAHPFPAPLHDVKLAIRWVKAVSGSFGLDPTNVIVAGGSAGANLALLAAVTPGRFEPPVIPTTLAPYDDSVAAVVDFVGPTDLDAFDHETANSVTAAWARSLGAGFLGCAIDPLSARMTCPTGVARTASVAPYVSSASPPVFMAYGDSDDLVPPAVQAIPLANLWATRKGTNAVWLETITDAGHNVTVAGLNDTYFDRFLDGVVAGSIH